jgi:hypothetical protein
MNKMMTAVAAAALATASVSASAWWGWGNDVVGDTALNADASSQGWANYYGYYAPYWGNPYGAVAPYGLSADQQKVLSEQQKAFAEQQKAFAEQQAQYFKQAVEAQRKLVEQWASNPPPAIPVFAPEARIYEMERQLMERAAADEREFFDQARKDLAAHPAPFTAPADLASFEDRVKEMDARRDQTKKDIAALREEATKQMEARREEAQKRFEAQREAARKRHSEAL